MTQTTRGNQSHLASHPMDWTHVGERILTIAHWATAVHLAEQAALKVAGGHEPDVSSPEQTLQTIRPSVAKEADRP